jgi:ABC-type uncharacterized transport system ATPase subunit
MPLVEMQGIVKRFGDLTANDRVDFAVERSEIRALVGENGAGKTTLMRVLFGLLRPDEGVIRLDGRMVDFHSPRDAIAHGVGMVHQHFMLFEDLSVADNVIYGMEPRRWGLFVDREQARAEVEGLANRHGFRVDPRAPVKALSVGERQRVEILKLLYRGADILILDEPTAVLTPQERNDLFAVLRVLAEQGKAIILITHKLKEVMAVAQSATVLRHGRVTGNVQTAETSVEELAHLMVGRRVLARIERPPANVGKAVLMVRGLTLENDGPRPLLDDVSLEVRAGEIVGVAGVAGNGQTELVDTLVGFRIAGRGTITIGGQDVTDHDVLARRHAGLAYIPEDRYQRGVAAEASIAENLAMGFQHDPPLVHNGLLSPASLYEWADRLADDYDIRMSTPREAARNLSGGNLQKVVLAREFTHDARLILADQPTRGVDIAATEFIHRRLLDRRNKGDAILLISADLDEILALSDRVLVMVEGRIAANRPADAIDEYELGLLMTGQPAEGPQA